jgi:hypothetical protein
MYKVKTTAAFQSAANIAIEEFLKRGGAVAVIQPSCAVRQITAK